MSEYNPVTQFRCEAFTKAEDRWYVLAGGVWLVCNKDEINTHGNIMKNMILFRDYWTVYCIDDGCAAAHRLRRDAR